MYYNNTDSKQYTESEIKALYPNTSFPSPFVAPDEFVVVFDTPKPDVTELQVAYQDGTELDSKGNRVVKWSIKDMFADTEEATKDEQEAKYLADKAVEQMKAIEQAVQAHINSVVISRGYDNENSIAKYLVVGNPFYDECKKISLWIGSVWVDMFNYKNGTKTYTTTEQLLLDLPQLEVV